MIKKFICASAIAVLSVSAAFADASALPIPVRDGGLPLMQAMVKRSSSREFADVELTPQELANLLWAACGINRAETDGRVYPAALGLYDISVYAITRSGVYEYDPMVNGIIKKADGDHRAESGFQPFVANAAVNLVYVQNTSLWADKKEVTEDMVKCFGFAHTGAAMQNVHLYAASADWGAVVRASFNADAVSKLLGLSETQRPLLIQSVGPKSK